MSKKIVFFDGFCNLCDSFAQSILMRRSRHELYISTLQGETAKKVLPPKFSADIKTLVYFDGTHYWTHSTAALKVFTQFGGVWHLMSVFYILPKAFRDMLYNFIARHRYRIFGQKEVCRRPTPEELERFLD